VWAGVLLAGSTVLVWIGPVLRFRHYIGDVDAFLRPTPDYALFDWLDLFVDVLMTGQPVRTMLRTACFAGAGLVLWQWRSRKDDRFPAMATLIAGSFVLAYVSDFLCVLRQTQPYRQVAPAALASAILLAHWLETAVKSDVRTWSPSTRVVLGVGMVLAAPRFVQTLLQFMPTFLPVRSVHAHPEAPRSLHELPLRQEIALPVLGHAAANTTYVRVRQHLEKHHRRGRVVCLDWALGEYLATFAQIPILGGIPQPNVPHVDAHPLRHDFSPRGPHDDPVAEYVRTYAVGAVVLNGPLGPLDARSDLWRLEGTFDDQRVYRTVAEPSYVAVGDATVQSQSLNRISVSDASGEMLVLRFHWMETLECHPGCRIQRFDTPRDRIGLIRIDSPPRRFEIRNRY
jgi:hypothetical protein